MPLFGKRYVYSQKVISAVDYVSSVINKKSLDQPTKFIIKNENRLALVAGCYMGCVSADPNSAKSPDLIDSGLISMGFDKLFTKPADSRFALSQANEMLKVAIQKTRTAIDLGVLISVQHFFNQFDYFNIFDVLDKYFTDFESNWHPRLDEDKENLSDEVIDDGIYIEATNVFSYAIDQMQSVFLPNLLRSNRQRFVKELLSDNYALGDFWGYYTEAYIQANVSKENGAYYTDVFMREVFSNPILARVVWQKCGELRLNNESDFVHAVDYGRSRFRERNLVGFMNTIIDGLVFTSPFEDE